MVNSSWTAGHVRQLWWSWEEPQLVYPPCDTSDLQSLPLDRRLKHLFLVSVAQFRPEKNHRLQLEAYAMAREQAGAAVCDIILANLARIEVCVTSDGSTGPPCLCWLQLEAYAMAREQAGAAVWLGWGLGCCLC